MDLLALLEFLHVSAAVLWLGGGAAMVLLGLLMGSDPDRDRFMALIAQVAMLAPRLFIPASVATLLTGLALVLVGGYGWPAWVVLGLAGIAFTAGFGGMVLGPLSERAVKAGPVAGFADGRRLLRLATFDYVVQFSIVLMMVAKPHWSDLPLLVAVAVAIGLGALLFLRPAARRA